MVPLKTDYLQLWFLYNSDLRISNVRKQERKKLEKTSLSSSLLQGKRIQVYRCESKHALFLKNVH